MLDKTEKCFYVKVNRLEFVFLTFHISNNLKVSLNLMSLAKDLFFKVGFPPCASNFKSKNELKSPAVISWVFWICIKLFQ